MTAVTGSLEHNPGLLDDAAKAEIVLYQSDGSNVPVEVRYLDETFWLTQREMADLFDTTPSNISMHLKHVFEEGELDEEGSLIKFRISEFNKKPTNLYNLDAIIAVGYRVNSLKATRFCQWAARTLRAPSPSDPAAGACWSREEDGLLIRLADDECDTELYERGTTLRQSLLAYSAKDKSEY